MPELEGKNLRGVTDKNGKTILPMILAALEDANNPHAWVHYSWWEPGKFYPVPKSSCHFKVTTPAGWELFVGGGTNHPHEEREFIRILFDDASRLLTQHGDKALETIADPRSQYNFRDVRVFVFDAASATMLAPSINSDTYQMNVVAFTDEAGHTPLSAFQ